MNLQPNIEDPDGFYERWLNALAGLDDQKSQELNARLILLLANQVGRRDLLEACIDAAAKPFRS